MRLIDADALMAELHETYLYNSGARTVIYRKIDGMPTVDAIEVVRCENCKHRNGDYCHRYQDGYSAFIHRDDFCNYAERRENETD